MNLDLIGHYNAVLQHLHDALNQQQLDIINWRRRADDLQDEVYRLKMAQPGVSAPSEANPAT